MAEHLGLEEKQASQREHEIQREIDRRWVEAKEKAEVEGYTAGLNTGKREAYLAEKPRIEEKLKRLETLLQSVDSMTANIFLANEDFLTKLMAQLLQIIAIKEIELDKEYLNRLVLHLINQMADRRELTLTIGELDLVLVQKLREAIEHKFPELTTLRILTNIDLKPGSCRLETKSVMIDASLENQIRNAMQVLSEDRGKPVK
jgi:flagellar biosynthesis/type III secretory pathway protein FliH